MPKNPLATPLAELHTHLGAAVDPAVLWSIAHRQGIKLPTKNYWEFVDIITMADGRKNKDLDQMHNEFFHWTELIQSSPDAIEEAVKGCIGGGYRNCNLVLQELRFNPMKRNRSGERDLDHIIQSAIWGVEKAKLEYPVRAGIILMMDRTLTLEQNDIICQSAIKYNGRGVIGLDLAGPERPDFSMTQHHNLFYKARAAGLGITIHTGEAGSLDELAYVVNHIKPDRIGHGIKCVYDRYIMESIRRNQITLETCPTSNIKNSVIKDLNELRHVYRTLIDNQIKFCINTDGNEMYRISIVKEMKMLRDNDILTENELAQSNHHAFNATFICD